MPDVGQLAPTAAIAPLHEWRASDGVSPAQVLDRREPTVLRGLVEDWPAVACAKRGPADVAAYLERFDRGAPVELFVGEPAMDGRYFYDDVLAGFNFRRATAPFPQFLAALLAGESGPDTRTVYAGSQPVRRLLPGLEGENPLSLMADKATEPRIWIGNRSRVA